MALEYNISENLAGVALLLEEDNHHHSRHVKGASGRIGRVESVSLKRPVDSHSLYRI